MRLIVRTLLRTRTGALRSQGAAAVLNCLLLCLIFPAPAAQDHFEDLRAKWFQLLTGGTNFNLNDPQVKPALSALDATAASNWKSMVTNQMTNRPYLWTNLTNSADAAEITKGYDRLRSMALAYATYGSAWKGDAGLAASIQDGLIWMTNRYNQTLRDNTTNWYDLEIGATLRIADIAVLMYGAPGVTNLADSLNVMDYFVPSPFTSPSNRNTGANLADKIRVV